MEYLSNFRLISETFFRFFVFLFKYCDLCNSRTSHQFIFKQVLWKAFSITHTTAYWLHPRRRTDYTDDGVPITDLVLTLAWCMLERSTNKTLLWNKNVVSSLTSVQAHSKKISVYEEIVTSFRSRQPSGLYRVNSPRFVRFPRSQI